VFECECTTTKDWLKAYCPDIYTVPVYSLNSVIELWPACVVHVDDAENERSKDWFYLGLGIYYLTKKFFRVDP
jgi:hypothetical protein